MKEFRHIQFNTYIQKVTFEPKKIILCYFLLLLGQYAVACSHWFSLADKAPMRVLPRWEHCHDAINDTQKRDYIIQSFPQCIIQIIRWMDSFKGCRHDCRVYIQGNSERGTGEKFTIKWKLHWLPNQAKLTAYNWQKWKRVFLTCYEIYIVEAVGLKTSNYTWKIMIFANMWNLGQFREKLIFCQ